MGHHGKHKCCSVCGAFINVVKVSSAVMTVQRLEQILRMSASVCSY